MPSRSLKKMMARLAEIDRLILDEETLAEIEDECADAAQEGGGAALETTIQGKQ
jgi:hypothetical protein